MRSGIVICEEDFDVAQVYDDIRKAHGSAVGALVTFVGLVRDRNPVSGDATDVSTLTLEHYPGMTEESIHKILDQASSRWPLLDVQVIHRIGTLRPGDQIVLVAVASGHRDAAFAAAEYVMDYLKTDAVLWKKEQTQIGEHWVQSSDHDHQRARQWRNDSTDKAGS